LQPLSPPVASRVYALAFSFWKKKAVRQCFPGTQVKFVSDTSRVPKGALLAVWGMKLLPEEIARDLTVVRLEDGFLRSVGLGADLIRPLSWVVDRRGIYYDATRPSDLEHLLESTVFESSLQERAALLRERVVSEGLTKYNVGGAGWRRPVRAKRVILVPGQVESDDSLKYGAPRIRSNIDLLKAVRQTNPNAHIVYKPHPDVVARLRAGGADEDTARTWCDELVTDVAMPDLLRDVDEVHVLTSLAGFEALMRRKAVSCYGQPFYSGWGLTTDIVPHPRRRRRLTLDELVAGTLIEYPLYFNRKCDRLITPEEAVDALIAWRNRGGGVVPWWRTLSRMALRRIVGVR
jgi:capsular polysaccharide export protein